MGTNAAISYGKWLPLYRRASVPNVTARQFYLKGLRQIELLNDFLTLQPLTAKERAVELVNTRNALRSETRAIMADRELARVLTGTDPNLTLDQLVQRARSKGLSGDDIWEELAKSAARSRQAVNRGLKGQP